MNVSRKLRRIALGFASVGLLAACGGGSASDGSSGDDGSSADGDMSVVTMVDIPGVDDSCEKVVNMIGALGQVMAGQISTEDARAIVDDFVAAVPDEIRGDAEVLVAAFTGYIDVLAKYDGDVTTAMSDPEVMTALDKISAAETNASTDRISAYLTDKCGWAG